MSYRHVFGPVISSRLDRSLGLDLLVTDERGEKTCSFDCVYCEVGPNPERTLQRSRFAPLEDILQELSHWREQHGTHLDHVTLGGSGEPCLHSEMGEIIRQVKAMLPTIPLAVLTNSSLLFDVQVRRELALADVVLPSLDTLVEGEFQRVNRPHPDLDIRTLADSLLQFREEFAGRLYLEVLLCAGVNDSEENLELLRQFIPRLRPDRVDVVTLSRPGAYAKGRPVDQDTLVRFREALESLAGKSWPKAGRTGQQPGTVLLRSGACQAGNAESLAESLAEEIYQSLRRRPQTAPQLAEALNAPVLAVETAVGQLKQQHRLMALSAASQQEPVFYKAL